LAGLFFAFAGAPLRRGAGAEAARVGEGALSTPVPVL